MFARGHHYFTLLKDGFWASLSEPQRAAVSGVAIDIWDPYIQSTRKHLPWADRTIVFDKFHIAKRVSEAIDQVRRRENKQLKAAGDDRLQGTRYEWLRHRALMVPDDRKQFAALRDSAWKPRGPGL